MVYELAKNTVVACNSETYKDVLSLYERLGFEICWITEGYLTRNVFATNDFTSNNSVDHCPKENPWYREITLEQLTAYVTHHESEQENG